MHDKTEFIFLCFALIHNVTLRVKGFRGKTPTLRGPECLGQPPPRNAKSARLAAFDKIGNVFSFTYMYSQMTAQQFRPFGVYCRHLYFMKIGHEINCCVFKSRESVKKKRAKNKVALRSGTRYIITQVITVG